MNKKTDLEEVKANWAQLPLLKRILVVLFFGLGTPFVIYVYFVASDSPFQKMYTSFSSEDINSELSTENTHVQSQTADEKARLTEEAERMRAASVDRENSVGKAEQQQLRNEADAGNRAYYSSSTQNFLEGHEYNYFGDSSCDKDCLTKAEAMQACNKVKGYTNRTLRLLAITSTSKDKALLEGGNVTNFSATWTGTNCYASLTIKGIYEGSSASTNIGGRASGFIFKNGEILVSYIDTF